jgi:hypothetical protein
MEHARSYVRGRDHDGTNGLEKPRSVFGWTDARCATPHHDEHIRAHWASWGGNDRMRVFKVCAGSLGWQLSGLGEPTFYRSGARAEMAARRLALAAARCGERVELQVFDRGGTMAAQLHF